MQRQNEHGLAPVKDSVDHSQPAPEHPDGSATAVGSQALARPGAATHGYHGTDPATPQFLGAVSLTICQLVWLGLLVLIVSIFAMGLPLYTRAITTPCGGADCLYTQLARDDVSAIPSGERFLRVYALYMSGLTVAAVLTLCAIAAVLIWRRPNTLMAVFVAFALMFLAPTVFAVLVQLLQARYPFWRLPVLLLVSAGLWCLVAFGYVFPNGHFVPSWTRPMAAVAAVALSVPLAFLPVAAILQAAGRGVLAILVLFVTLMATAVAAQVYRYHSVSSLLERQQVKWVVFGFSLFMVEAIAFALSPQFFSPLRQPGLARALYFLIGCTLNVLALLLFTASFAIAIRRYHLWDIDVLIRRTVIYGLLTVVLSLVYVVGQIMLQASLSSMLGQTSQLETALSTLMMIVLFLPLRRRIQQVVDRRFYRRKYDAQQVLAGFGDTLRHEIEIDRVTAHLLQAVQNTMQPEQAGLWLWDSVHLRQQIRSDGTDTISPRIV